MQSGKLITRSPVSELRIDHIEKKVGLELPVVFKTFLLEVGLTTPLIEELPTDLNHIESVDEILLMQERHKFIRIGGQDEYLLMKDRKFCTDNLYYYDFYKEYAIVDTGISFMQKFEKALQEYKPPEEIENSARVVEYSFEAFKEIFDILVLKFAAQKVEDFKVTYVTNAGVRVSSCKLEVSGTLLEVKKSEFKDWLSPQYSFKIKDQILQKAKFNNDVLLQMLEENQIDFKSHDYGIMHDLK